MMPMTRSILLSSRALRKLKALLACLIVVALLIEAPLSLHANAMQASFGVEQATTPDEVPMDVSAEPNVPAVAPTEPEQGESKEDALRAELTGLQAEHAMLTSRQTSLTVLEAGLAERLVAINAQIATAEASMTAPAATTATATPAELDATIQSLTEAIATYNQNIILLFNRQFVLGQEVNALRQAGESTVALENEIRTIPGQVATYTANIEAAEAEIAVATEARAAAVAAQATVVAQETIVTTQEEELDALSQAMEIAAAEHEVIATQLSSVTGELEAVNAEIARVQYELNVVAARAAGDISIVAADGRLFGPEAIWRISHEIIPPTAEHIDVRVYLHQSPTGGTWTCPQSGLPGMQFTAIRFGYDPTVLSNPRPAVRNRLDRSLFDPVQQMMYDVLVAGGATEEDIIASPAFASAVVNDASNHEGFMFEIDYSYESFGAGGHGWGPHILQLRWEVATGHNPHGHPFVYIRFDVAPSLAVGTVSPLTFPVVQDMSGGITVLTVPGSVTVAQDTFNLTINNFPTAAEMSATIAGQTISGLRAAGTPLNLQSGSATPWNFLGWATNASNFAAADGMVWADAVNAGYIVPFTAANMPANDVTIYAVWGFDVIGGGNVNITVEVLSDLSGTRLPYPDATLTGFTNVGNAVAGTFTITVNRSNIGTVLTAAHPGFAPNTHAISADDMASRSIVIRLDVYPIPDRVNLTIRVVDSANNYIIGSTLTGYPGITGSNGQFSIANVDATIAGTDLIGDATGFNPATRRIVYADLANGTITITLHTGDAIPVTVRIVSDWNNLLLPYPGATLTGLQSEGNATTGLFTVMVTPSDVGTVTLVGGHPGFVNRNHPLTQADLNSGQIEIRLTEFADVDVTVYVYSVSGARLPYANLAGVNRITNNNDGSFAIVVDGSNLDDILTASHAGFADNTHMITPADLVAPRTITIILGDEDGYDAHPYPPRNPIYYEDVDLRVYVRDIAGDAIVGSELTFVSWNNAVVTGADGVFNVIVDARNRGEVLTADAENFISADRTVSYADLARGFIVITLTYVPTDYFTVTFRHNPLNGSVGAPVVVSTLTVPAGTTLIAAQVPGISVANGFIYVWTSNPAGNTPAGHVVTGNIVFTAVVMRDTIVWHPVTFSAGVGGSLIGTVGNMIQEGTAIIPTQIPTPMPNHGWSFVGWTSYTEPGYLPYNHLVMGPIHFVAQFVQQQQRVNFAASHGGYLANNAPHTANIGFNTMINFTHVPTPIALPGYVFTGWDVTPFGHVVVGDVVFTANFAPVPEYFIIFTADEGGTLRGPLGVRLRHGDIVTTDHIPTPIPNPGWRFAGWDASNPEGHIVTGGITFIARFVQDVVNVTFIAGENGRFVGEPSVIGPIPVDIDDVITGAMIPTPEANTGYTFAGWTPANPDGFVVTESVVFVAHFTDGTGNGGEPLPLDIVFNIQSSLATGTAVVVSRLPGEYVLEDEINVQLGVPHDTIYYVVGATFLGWSLTPVIDVLMPGEFVPATVTQITLSNSTVEVWAVWAQDQVIDQRQDVRFWGMPAGDPANHIVAVMQVPVGAPAIPPSDPIRAGYIFNGWRNDNGDSVTVLIGSDFFASWTPDPTEVLVGHTVLFAVGGADAHGGIFIGYGSQLVRSDIATGTPFNAIGVPVPFAHPGYVFAGWTDSDPAVYAITGVAVTENRVFTAHFVRSMVEVRFIAGHGGHIEGTNRITIPEGQNLFAGFDPARPVAAPGYAFWRWVQVDTETEVDHIYDTSGTPVLEGHYPGVTASMTYRADFLPVGMFGVAFEAAEGGILYDNVPATVVADGRLTVAQLPGVLPYRSAAETWAFSHWAFEMQTANGVVTGTVDSDDDILDVAILGHAVFTAYFVQIFEQYVHFRVYQYNGINNLAGQSTVRRHVGHLLDNTEIPVPTAGVGHYFYRWMGYDFEAFDELAPVGMSVLSRERTFYAQFNMADVTHMLTISNQPGNIGPHIGQTASGTRVEGTSMILAQGSAPVRWVFLGWVRGDVIPEIGTNIADFDGAVYPAGHSFTMPGEAVRFTAVWGDSGGIVGQPDPPPQQPPIILDPADPPVFVIPQSPPRVREEFILDDYDVPLAAMDNFRARFMIGYPSGYFMPNGNITRAEAAALLVRTMTTDFGVLPRYANGAEMFSDVSPGAWYFNYIATAFRYGLIVGFPDGTFRPDQAITRQEFAGIMARATNNIQVGGRLPYLDAYEVSGWAFNYVYTMLRLDWMHGDAAGTFRPQSAITRAEAAALVSRALNRGEVNASSIARTPDLRIFPDAANPGAWHYFYVIDATNSRWFSMDGDVEIWTAVMDYTR